MSDRKQKLMLLLSGTLALGWLAVLAYFFFTTSRTCAGEVIFDTFGIARCVASGGVR